MKKVLLVLSLLGLVLTESSTNSIFGWGRRYAPSDYPSCCAPQLVNNGCRTRCCRPPLIGRARWSCCKTLNCCRPKKVCCPRYKCCPPKPACCPVAAPVCETNACVTTPRTTCVEDYSNIEADRAKYAGLGGSSYVSGNTTCVEDYSNGASYPTSYGQPTVHTLGQEIV